METWSQIPDGAQAQIIKSFAAIGLSAETGISLIKSLSSAKCSKGGRFIRGAVDASIGFEYIIAAGLEIRAKRPDFDPEANPGRLFRYADRMLRSQEQEVFECLDEPLKLTEDDLPRPASRMTVAEVAADTGLTKRQVQRQIIDHLVKIAAGEGDLFSPISQEEAKAEIERRQARNRRPAKPELKLIQGGRDKRNEATKDKGCLSAEVRLERRLRAELGDEAATEVITAIGEYWGFLAGVSRVASHERRSSKDLAAHRALIKMYVFVGAWAWPLIQPYVGGSIPSVQGVRDQLLEIDPGLAEALPVDEGERA